MTVQEKKKWLMRYQIAKKEIDRLLEEQAQLRAFCTRVTPVLSPSPKGSGNNKKDDSWARLVDLNKQIEDKVIYYIKLRQEIEAAISLLIDEEQQLVLRYRYINGYTWIKIARKLHTSERTSQRIHEKAINVFSLRGM